MWRGSFPQDPPLPSAEVIPRTRDMCSTTRARRPRRVCSSLILTWATNSFARNHLPVRIGAVSQRVSSHSGYGPFLSCHQETRLPVSARTAAMRPRVTDGPVRAGVQRAPRDQRPHGTNDPKARVLLPAFSCAAGNGPLCGLEQFRSLHVL